MKISFIVAMAENGVIGRHGKLPWYLPEDLKYFKRVTMGKPIVMGRKTFESIGKPLPGRTNIIVTHHRAYNVENAKIVHSLEEAETLCESIAEIDGSEEIMIIGGEQLFREAFPKAQRLYLTEVHAKVDGDTYFPEFDRSQWREQYREDFQAEDPNPYDYSFVILDRK